MTLEPITCVHTGAPVASRLLVRAVPSVRPATVKVNSYLSTTYRNFDQVLELRSVRQRVVLCIGDSPSDPWSSAAERSKEKPVLVEFYATWCGPCALMARELPRVQGVFRESVKVIKVNADKYPEICQRLHINALPSLVLLKDGMIFEASRSGLHARPSPQHASLTDSLPCSAQRMSGFVDANHIVSKVQTALNKKN